jgi:cytoskeletal protein RodZ
MIRTKLIHDIEDDDFRSCGAPVYARGHVRAIARTVGIDPSSVLDEMPYESDLVEASPEAGGSPEATPAPEPWLSRVLRPWGRRQYT